MSEKKITTIAEEGVLELIFAVIIYFDMKSLFKYSSIGSSLYRILYFQQIDYQLNR
jgi:hypothetical protein